MRRLLLLALACALLAPAASAEARTVWLCKPGLADDPCSPSLSTTRFSPAGERLGSEDVRRARRRKVDCFYVYPTVSDQPGLSATRAIDPELRSIALYQAARYSRDCRVFAPVYRQITLRGIFTGFTPELGLRAYRDVRSAWRDYLRNHNRGRGVVLIGHSQGTFILRKLITEEIDRRRAVRRRLVSALLLGGNVMVRPGEDAGGDFRNVRACRSARQLGCVVAFSVFDEPVPAEARFGRSTDPALEVLCTNPAALRGGAATLDAMLPSAPFAPGTTFGAVTDTIGFPTPQASTAWLAFPDAYTARCVTEGGASALQIAPLGGAPVLRETPDASWGLHVVDANIALGNLARLVRRQAARFVADAMTGGETEGRAAALADLDLRPTVEVVRAVVRGHRDVLAAVEAAEPAIAALADAAAERLAAGGRVVYAGAGSAGWLAFVDATEWGPTFSVPADTVVALVAGAEHPPGSVAEAAAEDDAAAGAAAVRALQPRADDVVIAVSASGRTPYALGALEAAAEAGALTAAVVCATGSPAAARAAHVVEAPVGAEVLSGSTRLKAGTAQKLVLNAFSTAVMVRRGRTLGDLMTSMRVANDKLRGRAVRLCVAATGCEEEAARAALEAAADDVSLAIVMLAKDVDAAAGRALLDAPGERCAPPSGQVVEIGLDHFLTTV